MGNQKLPRPRDRNDRPALLRAGFSLIELLVAIGIIGVLIALIVPALWGVRSVGEKSITLANLRQTHTVFELYTQHFDEQYPWYDGIASIPLSPSDEPGSSIRPGYWDLSIYWPGLMHEVAPWREHFTTWLGGGAQRDDPPWKNMASSVEVTSFEYCRSFMARPQLWREGADDDPALRRPARVGDVQSPSSKVLLFDRELSHLRTEPDADRDNRPMVFADGHASEHRLSEATEPVALPGWEAGSPLHDTPNGVRGRDY